ncbi:MAG: TRAP transporter substrate-binding protein [Notoacmeibacter sp.]|nr:TRAP transporter substrate-binding protein [Notoacmeibacter sp.]
MITTKLSTILAAAVTMLAAPQAGMADALRLKLQTHFNPALSVIGEASKNYVDTVKTIAGDDIEIRFYEANKLAPTVETFGAVRDGTIDAVFGWVGYFSGQVPAFSVFSDVPFGPSPEEFMTWMYEGEGTAIANDIFEKNGVHGTFCALIPGEGGGWFREELGSAADLKGKKLRWSGTGGKVLQEFGASVSVVPTGEIFPNMERGVLDATEFSLPSVDKILGLYKIAKHMYVPGWHAPYNTEFLMVNLGVWNGMSPEQRSVLEVACKANVAWTLSRGLGEQAQALAFYREEGVRVHRWSDADLASFREIFGKVIAGEAAADADYKRALDSLDGYIAALREWTSLNRAD